MTESAEAVLSTVKQVCVVGVGLIGGSFAKALKENGFPGLVTGTFRTSAKAQRALDNGVVDKAFTDVPTAVAQADVILLAVPMLSMQEQLRTVNAHARADAIITDAGSVKQTFIADVRETVSHLNRVVPGHPIAGKEKSGLDAADSSLFEHHKVLLTPLPESDASAIAVVQALWEKVGGSVECLDAAHHDRVLAATSHLPHVLAFAIVDQLAEQQQAEEIFRYSAGGFRDFSRIASGDPIMWRDICLTNRDTLYGAIEAFEENLRKVKVAIGKNDADTIERVFRRAKEARDKNLVEKS